MEVVLKLDELDTKSPSDDVKATTERPKIFKPCRKLNSRNIRLD